MWGAPQQATAGAGTSPALVLLWCCRGQSPSCGQVRHYPYESLPDTQLLQRSQIKMGVYKSKHLKTATNVFNAKDLIKLSTSLQKAFEEQEHKHGNKIHQQWMLVNQEEPSTQGHELKVAPGLHPNPRIQGKSSTEPWSGHFPLPRQWVRRAASPSGGSPQLLPLTTSPGWGGEPPQTIIRTSGLGQPHFF